MGCAFKECSDSNNQHSYVDSWHGKDPGINPGWCAIFNRSVFRAARLPADCT